MDSFSLKFDAVFFPDTQQAVLESEQKTLRLLSGGNGGTPFCFFPPCIPLRNPETKLKDTALEAFPPEAENGWIIRRTNLRAEPEAEERRHSEEAEPGLPVPLNFPRDSFIVIGYAGDKSAELLDLYRKETGGGASGAAGTLRAEVWYRTELCVEVKGSPGCFFNSSWRTGNPEWKKRST